MRIRLALLFPALLIIIICIGLACSGGSNGPLTPATGEGKDIPVAPRDPADIFAGGLWEVAIDKATGEVNITTLRSAEKAMNVLSMLEPPTLFFLSINLSTLEVDFETGYVGANVILNHPVYSGKNQFRGFDVRGIIFGPYLANADGYTPLLRPSDFKDMPFGYIDGMLGVPADWTKFNKDIYPYKYFADELGAEDDVVSFFNDPTKLAKRGKFNEGSTNVRHYDMYFDVKAGKFLIFNYAVLVSYDFPTGSPPYELSNFPIATANCAEPFLVKAEVIQNGLFFDPVYGGGGTISINVEAYDWQNIDGVEVQVESPSAIQPVVRSEHTQGATGKSGVFEFIGISGTPQSSNPVDITVTAIDTGTTFGDSFFMHFMPSTHDLYHQAAYTAVVLKVPVADNPIPWVGPVQGDKIFGLYQPKTFTVQIQSTEYPSGPFTCAWEKGDDIPAEFDDGNGGNDGSIELSYNQPGYYEVDCEVTDPGNHKGTSILPLPVIVAKIPPAVEGLTLKVNRWSDYSIKSADNVTLEWDPNPDAAEYAVYYDPNPMDGSFNPTTLAGVTQQTRLDFTLPADGAAAFVVKARGLAGFPETEGNPSNYAFVDFEQAEVEGSEGSWEGNSIYDNPNLKMERSSNYAHKLSGEYGWYDGLGASSDYQNSYEVFYSDPYPEIAYASTFLLEVAHRVYNYNYLTTSEDGYGMGYIISSNPIPGKGPDNYMYFVVQSPVTGSNYWAANDAMTDEFTYSLNPDAGYTYSYGWRLSTFNVNMLQWAMYDRVAIGHATDTGPLDGAFLALDDIAVIIY